MQFQQPLNYLLNSTVKVRILRFLCRKGGEWNGCRMAAELAVHPTTAHKALRELRQATVLDFKKGGNNFLYSLRDEHDLVRGCLRPLFEREASVREHLLVLLRQRLNGKLRRDIVTVAIYGSLARRQERPTSDVDLLVLVTSNAAKQAVRQTFDRLGEQVHRVFGNPLALYINTVREAQQKVRRGLPLFKNILTEHQVVWGKPLAEVLRGRPT